MSRIWKLLGVALGAEKYLLYSANHESGASFFSCLAELTLVGLPTLFPVFFDIVVPGDGMRRLRVANVSQ